MIEAGGLQLPELYLMDESTRELMFQVGFLVKPTDSDLELCDVGKQLTTLGLSQNRPRSI